MMRRPRNALSLALATIGLSAAATLAHAAQAWTEHATAAAHGYCLAKHINPSGSSGEYSADGFEFAKSGHIGTVRRNYVHMRNPSEQQEGGADSGLKQTCEQACRQFGQTRFGGNIGVPLHVRDPNDSEAQPSSSGLEMAHNGLTDWDFYNNKEVVAGIWGASGWHEADVAQADFCCCQLGPALNPEN